MCLTASPEVQAEIDRTAASIRAGKPLVLALATPDDPALRVIVLRAPSLADVYAVAAERFAARCVSIAELYCFSRAGGIPVSAA